MHHADAHEVIGDGLTGRLARPLGSLQKDVVQHRFRLHQTDIEVEHALPRRRSEALRQEHVVEIGLCRFPFHFHPESDDGRILLLPGKEEQPRRGMRICGEVKGRKGHPFGKISISQKSPALRHECEKLFHRQRLHDFGSRRADALSMCERRRRRYAVHTVCVRQSARQKEGDAQTE